MSLVSPHLITPHTSLINLHHMYYISLIHLSLSFHNPAYFNHISYTSSYISHPFHYSYHYHIPLTPPYLLSHPHMSLSYTSSRLLYNSYNLLISVSSHLHIFLYTLIHPVDNSYNPLLPLSYRFNNMLYILQHPLDNLYNSLIHLFLSYHINHILMHPVDNFYKIPKIQVFNFNNILMHPVDNSYNLLIHPLFHFNNLNKPNNFAYKKLDINL